MRLASILVWTVSVSVSALACVASADVGPGPRPPRPQEPPRPRPPFVVSVAQFVEHARPLGFSYQLPVGFDATAVLPNRDMLCDFAVHDATRKLEVRYALRPIARDELQRYQDYVNQRLPPGTVVTDPNQRSLAEFMAVSMNVSGGGFKAPQHLQPSMAQELFGADAALVATLADPKSQFAAGWKRVMVVQIFKRDVGHGYLFLLYNDDRDLPAAGLAYPPLRALKFAPRSPPKPDHPVLIPPT